MIKNYFKTTLRSLLRNRGYSFLNITGLAVGITCASLIFLWVQDELSYNHNFEKRDYLYRINENQTYNGKISTFIGTPAKLAAAIKNEIPGIKNAARFNSGTNMLFSLGDKNINEEGGYADSALFSMLNLPFVHGDRGQAFKQLNSVVITETMALKFFGSTDVIGKTLRMSHEQNYTVTGVIKDLPKNSTIQFQWLAPYEVAERKSTWMQYWGANGVGTYVELQPGASVDLINQKLRSFIATKVKDNTTVCFLFNMNDWNLHNNFVNGKMEGGRIQYVQLFSAIAWIILLIACINFMNLSTASSEKRAKEVGVRKVMGAGKGKLIGQFISEAILLSFTAVIAAIGLAYLSLPSFNNLFEKELAVDIFAPSHLAYLLTIGVFTGLLAGSYPAFYLSSFNPISVLKNIKIKASFGSGLIRKSLVVIQFAVSVVLIIGTVVIYQQIQHVKNRDLGYNKHNLIYLNTQGKVADNFNAIYNDLLQTGVVQDASLSDYPVLQIWNNSDNYKWDGKDPAKNPLITWEDVSPRFINSMDMKLVSGRNFNADSKVDSNNVIINEALAKQMGAAGKVGNIIRDGGSRQLVVVGIIKDFLYNTMYSAGEPLILLNHPAGTAVMNIRFKQGADLNYAINKIEAVMRADNPGYPFEYKFIDDDFDQLFKTETLTSRLAGVFAVLAIFISCLGLFGLAAYTAERRIKEIGIRKVLGASVTGVTALLSKDFLQLVLYSLLLAFPIAWWATHNWLQNYQYRVEIHWWVFMAAGILAMFIALATISFQAIKAAIANPVKSLRSE